MQNIIIQIATFLNIPNIDVYFVWIILILFILFCVLWITKIYEVLFWLVLWIAIFIVMQFLLLNPNLQVPTFMNDTMAKFIVWSSIYLIFILSILVPLNWSLHINEPKNTGIKVIQILLLSFILTIFYTAIIFWFIEKTYIFTLDNAFQFLKKVDFWNEFTSESKLYPLIINQVPSITLFWVFFVIYKVTFSDVINMIIKTSFDTIKKIVKSWGWGGGHDDWWWHDDWHWHH